MFVPEVPVNYLAVLVAAIASMAIGSFWFSMKGFGKQWMELSGITPGTVDAAKTKGMQKTYAIAFVGSLVMSYVLAHALVFASAYTQTSGVSAGLMVGFWNWLGFVAPVTLGVVLWEGKPWKLWILSNAYYLITFLVMGLILVLWP